MKITGRKLLAAGTVALFTSAAGLAEAADTWRLSSQMPPDSFEGKAYTKFSELAEQHSGGKLDVRVFPSSQLGKINAVVEQLSAGTIQLVPSSATFLGKWVPEIRYISAPFAFEDGDHWVRFMESELVAGWLKQVEEKSGITLLGKITDFPRGSYRVLVSKKPITSVDDLKNLKVRQFSQELVVEGWGHLGAEVRVMAWNEVYDGLNRGIIEAVTSPAELVESMRFYEVAPHVTRTNEYPQGIAFMMNKEAFDGLDAAMQEALTKAHQDASAFERELLKTELAASLERLKAAGTTYSEDLPTRDFVQRMWDFYKAREAAGKLPEGFLEAVDAARAG